MLNFLGAIVGIAYVCLGIFQFVAMFAGLTDWIGLHWMIAGPVSLLIAYIPLVGTVLGIMGAMTAWNWPLLHALALFLGPLVVIAALALASGAFGALQERVR